MHGHHISYTSSVQSRLDYMQILSCMVRRQPIYINYSVHKTRCLVSYSLAVIALVSYSMRLYNIHWLPVRKRIDFKLVLPTRLKILSTHQPAYALPYLSHNRSFSSYNRSLQSVILMVYCHTFRYLPFQTLNQVSVLTSTSLITNWKREIGQVLGEMISRTSRMLAGLDRTFWKKRWASAMVKRSSEWAN